MTGLVRKLTAAAVAAALTVVPAGAVASTQPVAPVTAISQQSASAPPANPWLALGAMTTSSGAASAVARQDDEDDDDDDDAIGFIPIAPLSVILASIALATWILLADHDGRLEFAREPVSP